MFAKLFGQNNDQVLVQLCQDDDGSPSIKYTFQPEGLGACDFLISFNDDDGGWDAAEKALAEVTEQSARQIVSRVFGNTLMLEQTGN